ncbi:MAG: hypothetical protein E4H20_08870 [Spirochaetales bacterium]|nr:MAG: hypothetical protein E4H20_08870 [Spirochaetales bacterium]
MAEELARLVPGYLPAVLVIRDEREGELDSRYRNETMILRAFAPALDSGTAVLAGWKPGGCEPAAMEDFLSSLDHERGDSSSLFDICYLGLGVDGHTAGLFPGDPALVSGAFAVRGRAPEFPQERLSLGIVALRSANRTRFLVRSAGKERALARLGSGDLGCPAVLAATGDSIAFVAAY